MHHEGFMMLRIYILAAILLGSMSFLRAQTKEIQLVIGDSLTLGPCTGEKEFSSIDLMIKTRWPRQDLTYNKETGEGFYNWFFNGDIDSGRLPCKYSGQKFRIASIHQYDKEGGGIRTVVFGQVSADEAVVLWIEIDDAVANGEVTF